MTSAILIRNVRDSVRDRFRAGAAARGLTQADYLDRLLKLADAAAVEDAARELGIGPVRV